MPAPDLLPPALDVPDPAARQHNFSAGPGALPEAVLREIRDELLAYPGLGASIIEVSHRSAAFTEIVERARERMRRLLGLGPEWAVMFLQGGASMQFHQVPLNLLPAGGRADYVDTGVWAAKAIDEARRVAGARGATVRVAGTSEPTGYDRIPAALDVDGGAAYLHFTSNNTIYGTQWPSEPDTPAPLVCDASSDFLSRRIETDRYGLIYAGAQKNIGPAGVTAVLAREAVLATRPENLPAMLDYGRHATGLYNTPPVFAVYAVDKVLGWIEAQGGLDAIAEANRVKAERLYGALDASAFYRTTVEPASRSRMNVVFRLPTPDLDARFASEAAAEGLLGLKGYRTVGGIRASLYNAVPLAAVEALVAFMAHFEAANG